MNEPGFNKVGESEQWLYGPRKLLLCGFTIFEQVPFLAMLQKIEFPDLPVVFITDHQAEEKIKDLFKLSNTSGMGTNSTLERATIMAGITELELHLLIRGYRDTGLPAQLWAALTPTSENWTLNALLKELSAEREEFKKMKQKKQGS